MTDERFEADLMDDEAFDQAFAARFAAALEAEGPDEATQERMLSNLLAAAAQRGDATAVSPEDADEKNVPTSTEGQTMVEGGRRRRRPVRWQAVAAVAASLALAVLVLRVTLFAGPDQRSAECASTQGQAAEESQPAVTLGATAPLSSEAAASDEAAVDPTAYPQIVLASGEKLVLVEGLVEVGESDLGAPAGTAEATDGTQAVQCEVYEIALGEHAGAYAVRYEVGGPLYLAELLG